MKRTLNCKGKLIDLNEPKVMGILNITPDSFYDKSRFSSKDEIIKKTESMLSEGATFIDVGAYLPPFPVQKSTKIRSKIDPKMHQFFDRFRYRFFIDFWSILEANLEPCWPLFRTKYGDPN